MTTNTSKAPERIWATPYDIELEGGTYCESWHRPDPPSKDATKYVRRDLFDAMQARAEKAEAENERLRAALSASVEFADWVADQTGIDMDETILTVRVMPVGREVGSKSWAEVQNDARAALDRKEET